ncbi:hypothetical protein ACJ73_10253 [Blastomyces percursus]|uniref:Uncharacterized protein n=1 Tax=Blastomyces percursus TaxID=1658174 RepID=A0A1J9Q0P4_9EURO|nr:hypothetical protein ACJ73_10253 [Blastomyces percursus]
MNSRLLSNIRVRKWKRGYNKKARYLAPAAQIYIAILRLLHPSPLYAENLSIKKTYPNMKLLYTLAATLLTLAATTTAAPQLPLPLDSVTGVVGSLPIVGGVVGGAFPVKGRQAPDEEPESEDSE